MAHLMKCYIKDEDAISLSIQQLACLNHSCWTILIISTSLKNLNQHANHQVDLCSFESFCAFDSCSTDLGECTRQVQRLISFIGWLGSWWLWLLWGSRWRHRLMATSRSWWSRSNTGTQILFWPLPSTNVPTWTSTTTASQWARRCARCKSQYRTS